MRRYNSIGHYKTAKNEGLFAPDAKPENWEIVNTNEDGYFTNHYGFKVWPLRGYMLDLFSVYGDGLEDAINILLDHLKEINYKNCFTYEEVQKFFIEDTGFEVKRHPEDYGLTSEQVKDLTEEECFDLLDEDTREDLEVSFFDNYIHNDNYDLFVWDENFQVFEWPDNYPSPESVKTEARRNRLNRRYKIF